MAKTVTAAALIASRGVNTLVLVHRTELLRQWKERLQSFLGIGSAVVGKPGRSGSTKGATAMPTCFDAIREGAVLRVRPKAMRTA